MPYILPKDRPQFDEILEKLPDLKNKGELEYCIYVLLKRNFMKNREYRYSNLHEAVYAGIHASEEFKRRYLDIRENEASQANGDI